jgi:hypothetical protein
MTTYNFEGFKKPKNEFKIEDHYGSHLIDSVEHLC